MRDGTRDVFVDKKTKTYRMSSAWKRRLRRLARHHAETLKKQAEMPGYLRQINTKTTVYDLINSWLRSARNG